MPNEQQYDVLMIGHPDGLDHHDDNVDVEVVFGDGSRYGATFFTLNNIERIMRTYVKTGECLNGRYFWSTDLIIIRDLSMPDIRETVADLIKNAEFYTAFAKL